MSVRKLAEAGFRNYNSYLFVHKKTAPQTKKRVLFSTLFHKLKKNGILNKFVRK